MRINLLNIHVCPDDNDKHSVQMQAFLLFQLHFKLLKTTLYVCHFFHAEQI